MKLWIQVVGEDEDREFSDSASYQVLASGVLRINSGKDIHLFSPAYWQEATIDTRSADQREGQVDTYEGDHEWQ